MKTTLEQVKEFHQKYGHAIIDHPSIQDFDTNNFRLKLLQEELDELAQALSCGSKEDVLDALTDLQYVLDGTYLALGLWQVKDEAFRRVHENNMTKVATGVLGKPSKPLGWKPPEFSDLV